jgi:hypothetical protein
MMRAGTSTGFLCLALVAVGCGSRALTVSAPKKGEREAAMAEELAYVRAKLDAGEPDAALGRIRGLERSVRDADRAELEALRRRALAAEQPWTQAVEIGFDFF